MKNNSTASLRAASFKNVHQRRKHAFDHHYENECEHEYAQAELDEFVMNFVHKNTEHTYQF